jgi:N-acetylglucosaminyl-diphospho-decaprenol L-rhamnosyltransferase
MHVAVCIVGYRNAQDIVRCLTALVRSTHSDFEVAICENGGGAAYAALAAAIPDRLSSGQPVRKLSASGNPGFAAGINRCIAETPDADAWWLLNPDTVPSRTALEAMCTHLVLGGFGAVGCTVYYADGIVESRGGRWRPWLARAVSLEHSKALDAPVDVPAVEATLNYLNGASMLVGRSFLTAAGPMREDYFLYVEEVEWCLRGEARGETLGLAAEAQVLHFKGTTTGSIQTVSGRSRAPVYLDERNKLLLTRDLYPPLLPVAAAASLVLIFLRFGRRRAWRQLGYGLSGWWAGLCGKRGKPSWIREA